MSFPYPVTSNFTSSFNTASYFNEADIINYKQNTNLPDVFFGKSYRDVVEFSYFNTDGDQNGWMYKNPKIKYISQVGVYKDVDNVKLSYNYRQTSTDYIQYQNEILIDIKNDLSASNVFDGQHITSYNFLRNVSGRQEYPLIISEISPSRTELKLIPTFEKRTSNNEVFYENLAFESFARKLVFVEDILDFLITTTQKFNCDENYKLYNQQFPNEVEYFKKSFGFKSDSDVISFINSIYNGAETVQFNLLNQVTFKNLTGINNYIKYWCYTYSKNIITFQDLYDQIKYIIQKEYYNQLNIINLYNLDLGVNLQTVTSIVYDLFVKLILNGLENAYINKFYSYYKNAINFGDGNIVRYVDHSFSNENETDDKHIELIIKLDSPLPSEYDLKTTCWISNVSIAPIVQRVILIKSQITTNLRVAGPDFSIKSINSDKYTLNNVSSLDPNITDNQSANINVIKKLRNLNIDYSDFSNFIVFSSAAVRTRILKNKLNSISSLNQKITDLSYSSSVAPTLLISASYFSEINSCSTKINDILNSFDGYESYLYKNQSLIEGSINDTNSAYYNYVSSAEEYDIENLNSLVTNTPEYIKQDSNNNDYLLFLSMIGHHFDNICQYIKAFPIINQSYSSDNYLPDFVYYMLKTFGWDTSTDFANKSKISTYLSDTISYKDKTETIWKRILDTLPQIYKTKGTEECINLILACHGIPLNILTVKEFGNNDVFKNKKTSYVYNAKYYFTKFDANNEFIKIPYSGSKSIEFTFKLNEDYTTNSIIEIANKESSDWTIFLTKNRANKIGNITFKIQDKSMVIENVPIFNRDSFFNVMLRRNETSSLLDPSNNEDYVPSRYDLYVKSYDEDRETFSHSSSIVLTRTYNEIFSSEGSLYFGNYNTSNKFVGLLDKINLISNPISDYEFTQYCRNYNFYGNDNWDTLNFRYNYDYPVNLHSSSGVVSIYPDFPAEKTLNTQNGLVYNFTYNSVTQSNCAQYSQSVYPYQFEPVEISQTMFVSQYGPNKLKNNKIRKIEQILTAHPSPVQSVALNKNIMSPDSNILGVYVSPFKVKDDDILNFYGDLDLMDQIGDPGNIFESEYKSLNNLRENYYKFDGEQVLYQEFMTLFKNYVDNSIFESIKNIIPARSKFLSGVLIEPSLLERSKIGIKPIHTEELTTYIGNIDLTDNVETNIFPTDNYNINIDLSEQDFYIKQYNLNNGYISNDGNEYYFTEFIQQNQPFYDFSNRSISYLKKIEETQEVYSNDKLSNPISITTYKVVSVPSSSYAKFIGEDYNVTANSLLSITNIYPFQHLSYKNKPLSKYQIYLNTSSSVSTYTDIDGNVIISSNSPSAFLNFNNSEIYVKSRNTSLTNIISPYEITSSVITDTLSYSPVLTQSLSLSQSIFNI